MDKFDLLEEGDMEYGLRKSKLVFAKFKSDGKTLARWAKRDILVEFELESGLKVCSESLEDAGQHWKLFQ